MHSLIRYVSFLDNVVNSTSAYPYSPTMGAHLYPSVVCPAALPSLSCRPICSPPAPAVVCPVALSDLLSTTVLQSQRWILRTIKTMEKEHREMSHLPKPANKMARPVTSCWSLKASTKRSRALWSSSVAIGWVSGRLRELNQKLLNELTKAKSTGFNLTPGSEPQR